MRTWDAERVESILDGGRTKPLVVTCAFDDQSPPLRSQFVVKAKGLPEVTDLTLQNELMGNLFARLLGLTTPEPALVSVSPEAMTAFNGALSEHGLSVEAGLAAGCEYLPGMSSPVPDVPLSEDEVEDAARIYAFDLIVQNPDRTKVKPNCGWREGRLVAFDFELCFSFAMLIGSTGEPWQLQAHGISEKHLLNPQLRGRDVDWEPIVSILSEVTEDDIDAIIEAVPAAWQRTTDRIKEHLLSITTHTSELQAELQGSIA